MKRESRYSILFIGLIITAMATRLLPHLPNFTAVGAAAVFGGFIFKDYLKALAVPLIAMFLSDLFINNVIYSEYTEGFTLFTGGFGFIYAAIIISVLLGKFAVNGYKPLQILGASIGSAVVFYLLTNFGAWLGNPMYPQNAAGLFASYTAGLPFMANQLLANVFYSAVLFGAAYSVVGRRAQQSLNA